jgi:LTXXQ motif family protein
MVMQFDLDQFIRLARLIQIIGSGRNDMRHRKICACWVLMLVLAARPGFAQQPKPDEHHPGGAPPSAAMRGGPMGGAGEMPMMGMMRMMMGQDGMSGMPMMAGMAGHVEGRLAFFKTELRITDTQLPLWNAVADAMRANAKTMGEMPGMMGSAQTGSLPERLATREKMMAAHLEALRKFKAAIDPLYAALSDEQKKTADELLMGPMGMM